MRNVNQYHQHILSEIAAHGLAIDALRKKYGMKFVAKLFTHLQKHSMQSAADIPVLYPKKNFDIATDYAQELKDTGLKLHEWFDPFIDEDTGMVVYIPRYSLKPLKPRRR